MAYPERSVKRRGWVDDAWYVIEDAAKVGRAPRGVTRFGERMVLFRDAEGTMRCTSARCAHRGADLSLGRVVGGEIECPYHGFRYEGASGRCIAAPCEGSKRAVPERMRVAAYPVREAYGFVWLWRGDPERATEVPWFPELPETPARSAYAEMVWKSTFARTMESMIDLHHFPFAHRRVGGSFVGKLLDPYEARSEDGVIRTRGVLREDDGAEHDGKSGTRFFVHVRFPSQIHLGLSESMPAFVACTPVDEERTWIAARYWIEVPIIGSLLAWLAIRSEIDLVQPDDQRMAETASPREPTLDDLCPVRADAGIVLWHRMADAAEKKRHLRVVEGTEGSAK